ncbi:MAG: sulfurtransferase TusA family protein [Pseudomonadota bacterium]
MNSEMNVLLTPDQSIDVTGELCPMTFVHVRLALDRLPPGAKLAVLLRGDEARRNVPRTATEQGHKLLSIDDLADGTTRLLIQKKG